MEKLYTVEELCERYGVKPITIWRWIKAGTLKATKFGRGWRVYESDLAQFEANKRKE